MNWPTWMLAEDPRPKDRQEALLVLNFVRSRLGTIASLPSAESEMKLTEAYLAVIKVIRWLGKQN